MKTAAKIRHALLLACLLGPSVRANSIQWTNTSAGIWSTAGSWSPNQVPGPQDNAFISGSSVTVTAATTVGSVTVTGGTLALDAPLTSTNAIVSGGALAGSGGTLAGNWTWTAGSLQGTLTLANTATLTVNTPSAGSLVLSGDLMNAGAITINGNGSIQLNGSSGGGDLVTLPGGVVVGQGNVTLTQAGFGSESFVNGGQLEARSGVLAVNTPQGGGGGQFIADSGAELEFANNYSVTDGAVFLGAGTNLIAGGTLTVSGNVSSADVVISGGTLSGANASLSGSWLWNGGNLSGSMTLATNGVLTVAPGGGTLVQYAILTNAGQMLLQGNGVLQYNGSSGGGEVVNLSQGRIYGQGNFTVSQAGFGSELLLNSGLFEAQTGTLAVNCPRGNGSGQFVASAGATLNFVNGFTINPAGIITGPGTNLISAGTLTLNGSLDAPNAVLGGGSLSGSGAVTGGLLTWTNGNISIGALLTVAAPATLNVIPGGGTLVLYGVLTNAGTLSLQGSGAMQLNGSGGGGDLVNLAGATILGRGTVSLAEAGYGSESFINAGVLQVTGGAFTLNTPRGSGSGQFTVNASASMNFANTFRLNDGGVLNGAGTNLLTGGVFTLDGNVAVTNTILAGAALAGTNAVINGALTWTGGSFASGGFLTLSPQAVLTVLPAGGTLVNYGVLTNEGTILIQGLGNVQLNGSQGAGQWFNTPGGRIKGQGNVGIAEAGYGSELFINSGLVEDQNGAFTLNTQRGGAGGQFIADTGAILDFVNNYSLTNGALLAGGGTNLLSGGTITLAGSVISSNAVLAGASLAGTDGILDGVWIWNSGPISSGSFLTVPTNGVLTVALAGNTVTIYGVLTNAGTMVLEGAGDVSLNGSQSGGQFYNLPGAVLDERGQVSITEVNYASETFENRGRIEIQNGELSLTAQRGSGDGQFVTDAGATTVFANGYTLTSGALVGGPGTNLLTGGTFVLDGNATVSNTVLAGAAWAGNGTLNGAMTWTGGSLVAGSALTLGPQAVLTVLPMGGNLTLYGVMTNEGAIALQGGGNLQLNGSQGGGEFFNLPGGRLESQGAVGISEPGYGSELFINSGVVEARSGTLSLDTQRGNAGGEFIADTGAVLNFVNNYTLTNGALLAGGGTNLFTGGTLTLEGTVTSSNAVLAGSSLAGNGGVFSGNWIWDGGYLAGGAALAVGTNGVLTLPLTGNSTLLIYGLLTNEGRLNLEGSGSLQCDGAQGGGGIVNAAAGVFGLSGAVAVTRAGYGSEFLANQGTLVSYAGTNTIAVGPPLANSGVIYAHDGALALTGSYSAGSPTLECGINSATSYGSINFSGNAALQGNLGIVLNNGYAPPVGSVFTLLNYASFTGLPDLELPSAVIWQTNQTSNYLSVTVTGQSAPPEIQLSAPAISGPTLSFSFNSRSGTTYVCEYKNALTDPAWTTLQTIPGTGGLLTVTDTPPSPGTRFYRARTQ